jgi:hypothetical protein
MTCDTNTQVSDELSLVSDKQDLRRILIIQFYEDSLDRYGIDSEQARTFARLLRAAGRGTSTKTSGGLAQPTGQPGPGTSIETLRFATLNSSR